MITISNYSGKCDLYDSIEINGLDNLLKSKIYAYDNFLIPLDIKTEKDLVPYYPYIIGFGSWSNGIGNIHLSKESFVDREERESLEFYQKQAIRYINRCKRKKIEPLLTDYLKIVGDYNREEKTKIYNRVVKNDMSLKDIHLPYKDYLRKILYDEMIRVGWSENEAKVWCFGWRTNYDILDDLVEK